jgi:hypothetical protein
VTDLERLGRHVGGQWEIEFWIFIRANELEEFVEPTFTFTPEFVRNVFEPKARYEYRYVASPRLHWLNIHVS